MIFHFSFNILTLKLSSKFFFIIGFFCVQSLFFGTSMAKILVPMIFHFLLISTLRLLSQTFLRSFLTVIWLDQLVFVFIVKTFDKISSFFKLRCSPRLNNSNFQRSYNTWFCYRSLLSRSLFFKDADSLKSVLQWVSVLKDDDNSPFTFCSFETISS